MSKEEKKELEHLDKLIALLEQRRYALRAKLDTVSTESIPKGNPVSAAFLRRQKIFNNTNA